MERKNYVKPDVKFNAINSASFIAGSKVIIDADEEGTVAALLLDKCVRFSGDLADNSEVIARLKQFTNYTACFKVQRWENSDKTQTDICPDSRFINGQGVQVTYDEENEKFIFDFNNCRGDDGVGGR